jgi:hypothetical protein
MILFLIDQWIHRSTTTYCYWPLGMHMLMVIRKLKINKALINIGGEFLICRQCSRIKPAIGIVISYTAKATSIAV